MLRRPKWIAAFLFAMLVAGVFAWLGQWQMDIALRQSEADEVNSEVVRPFEAGVHPGESVTDLTAGAVFDTPGSFVAGDFSIVENRTNQGEVGYWVTGHAVTPAGHLPVAIGWAPTQAEAEAAVQQLDASLEQRADIPAVPAGGAAEGSAPTLEGRYLPPDAAVVPARDADPLLQSAMVPGHLINVWQPYDGAAYAGFLVMHPDASSTDLFGGVTLAEMGLDPIDSNPPLPAETINWLNVFYSIEWIVFGGFAMFFWYRLGRDEWEKEHELLLLAAAEEKSAAAAAESSAQASGNR